MCVEWSGGGATRPGRQLAITPPGFRLHHVGVPKHGLGAGSRGLVALFRRDGEQRRFAEDGGWEGVEGRQRRRLEARGMRQDGVGRGGRGRRTLEKVDIEVDVVGVVESAGSARIQPRRTRVVLVVIMLLMIQLERGELECLRLLRMLLVMRLMLMIEIASVVDGNHVVHGQGELTIL